MSTIVIPTNGFKNHSATLEACAAIVRHLVEANVCDKELADYIAPDILANWGEWLDMSEPDYYELNEANTLAMLNGMKSNGDFYPFV